MQYREFGRTWSHVSALGLGCMRLPLDDSDYAAQVVEAAIAKRINYLETTAHYVNGRCQHTVAGGLKGRSRGLIVSGKTGIDEDTTADTYRRDVEQQMGALGVDYLESYQVGWFSWEKMPLLTRRGGAPEALYKARDDRSRGCRAAPLSTA